MNKMAYLLRRLSQDGFTQICVARGVVAGCSKDSEAAGELQLWHSERDNNYCLYAGKTARDEDMVVCKVVDVFALSLGKVY